MVSSRQYYLLGLSATISTLAAGLLSLGYYLYSGRSEYLVYAVLWLLISLLDYIVWHRPPRKNTGSGEGLEREEKYCGLLRESAELVAILATLSEHRGEYAVAWRIDSLLSRVDSMKDTIINVCGGECFEEFDKFLKSPSMEEASKAIRSLHDCMISHGCRSNVSLEE